jgi:hypothetical protein
MDPRDEVQGRLYRKMAGLIGRGDWIRAEHGARRATPEDIAKAKSELW